MKKILSVLLRLAMMFANLQVVSASPNHIVLNGTELPVVILEDNEMVRILEHRDGLIAEVQQKPILTSSQES
ncbi:MAG: hypothetical protein FWF59_15145 [Turicibacter sp.]|nr:hypothetical protein [Turicibacter sp.]